MDSGGLLQRLNYMRQEFQFDLAGVGEAIAIGDVEVADDALTSLVDKKGVAEDASALDGRIAGQDFGVDVAENHFRRAGVVPGKLVRPELRLIVEQRTQVHRGKVPEVENLQEAPAKSAGGRHDCEIPSLVCFADARQTGRTRLSNRRYT